MKRRLLILILAFTTGTLFSQLMIVGPDDPHLNVVTNGSQITISLYNPPISNNYLELYAETINDNSYLAPGYTDSIRTFRDIKFIKCLIPQ